MPKYLVQRVRTYEIEIDAEDGEAAVEIAAKIGTEGDDSPWDSEWNDEYFYSNEDDEEDEGEVGAF